MTGLPRAARGRIPQFVCVAFCLLASSGLRAAAPELHLEARVRAADGTLHETRVAPGGTLASGDEVRLRVVPARDGYLYVIALGSSGTATALLPFGAAAPAPVRAGRAVAVPGDGGYLPLDERAGKETLIAFTTPEPVPSLAPLLVRMEARLPDRDAARRVLEQAGFDAAELGFTHTAPGESRAVAERRPAGVPAGGAATASPGSAATGTAVLGASGSRIARFTAKPVRGADVAEATADRRETARGAGPGPGDGAAAVPASPSAPAPRLTTQPPGDAASDPYAPKPTGRMVPPLAVEATISPESKPLAVIDEAPPPALPAPPPEPGGRVAGTVAQLFNAGGEVRSEAGSAVAESPSVAPAPSLPPQAPPTEAETEDAPPEGLLAGLGRLLGEGDTAESTPEAADADVAAGSAGAADSAPAREARPESDPAGDSRAHAAAERAAAGDADAGSVASDAPAANVAEPSRVGPALAVASDEPSLMDRLRSLLPGAGPAEQPPADEPPVARAIPLQDAPQPVDAAAPTADEQASPAAAVPSAAGPPAASPAPESPGVLDRIRGWLQGGQDDDEQAAQMRADTLPRGTRSEPTVPSVERVDAPPVPASDSRAVVPTQPLAAADSEVLGGAGSRIRAWLREPVAPPDTQRATRGAPQRAPARDVAPEPPADVQSLTAVRGPVAADVAAGTLAAAPARSSEETSRDRPAEPAARPGARVAAPAQQAAIDSGRVATGAGASGPRRPRAPVAPDDPTTVALAPTQASRAPARARAKEQGTIAVVLVVSPDGAGTGVVLDGRGLVLTNWTLVRDFDQVVVSFAPDSAGAGGGALQRRARVVAHSRYSDLALLEVRQPPGDAVAPTVVTPLQIGEGAPILAIGHGESGHREHHVAILDRVRPDATWSSVDRVSHRADVVRIGLRGTANLAGAPLLSKRLELIGLGTPARAQGGELIGVSADTIRAFLSERR